MGFLCSDVLQVFSDSGMDIQVIAGTAGLDRVVRWPYVADAMDNLLSTVNWLSGSELVVLSGSNIVGATDKVLVEFLKRCSKKHISGIIINTGKWIPQVPRDVLSAADALSLPLMIVPWETKFVELTKLLCTAIIKQNTSDESISILAENLLLGRYDPDDKFESLLKKYNFDLAFGYIVFIFEVHSCTPASSYQHADCCAYLATSIRTNFQQYGIHVVTTYSAENVIAIAKTTDSSCCYQKILLSVVEKTKKRFYTFHTYIAIGKLVRKASDIPLSFKTAQQALNIHPYNGNIEIVSFDDLGLFALLFAVADESILLSYYQDLFDPIFDFDRSNGTKLMSTLEAYINNNGSLVNTAKQLYIHTNTLKYRLNKIHTLANIDLSLLEDQSRVLIGLKIGKMLGKM